MVIYGLVAGEFVSWLSKVVFPTEDSPTKHILNRRSYSAGRNGFERASNTALLTVKV